MSFSYGWRGPNIIKEGLVLYLDAGSPNSYFDKTSTTWKDISGNNIRCTLVNQPIFNNNNYGSIVFDGINEYATTNTFSNVSNNFTMDVWCRPSGTITVYSQTNSGFNPPYLNNHKFVISPDNRGTAQLPTIASGAGISVGTNGINVIEHGNSFFPAPLVYYTTISSTNFTNITVVYISKQPYLYVNGVFIKSGLVTTSPTTYLSIGSDIGSLYGFYQGAISIIKCYSLSLSPQEVLQNYNSTKARFGL